MHISQGAVQHLQGNGIEQGAEYCGHGKLLAQHQPAQSQHQDIEHEDELRHGNVQQLIDHQGNTGGAAADEFGRQHEELDGQGIDTVAQDHHQKGYDSFVFFIQSG